MVAHTIQRPRSQFPLKGVQFEDDVEMEEQKISVAPDSDKVVPAAV